MPRSDHLFVGPSWFDVDQHQRLEMQRAIEAMDADRLLRTSLDDLSEFFKEKYSITVPELLHDEIIVDQQEKQIDVSRDSRRFIMDRSRPFHVAGTEIEVTVPFSGEPDAFKIRPNPYSSNPPRGAVSGSNLIFTITGTDLTSDGVKAEIDRTLNAVEDALKNLRGNAEGLNGTLAAQAKSMLSARHEKLLASKQLIGSLGFKMRERPGSAKTYVSPEVRRRITPVMPPATIAPFKPEPALSDPDYDHIISVMQNMTQVMELSPSAFLEVDEEALRSHFLVQLNGHYLGQATGETFNYEGKTDILIRSGGKNIFIAECKFWSGPKMLSATIDQLLGYSSWRDTKTAIVVFNRNKDFSKVLAAIPDIVKSHPNYKRALPGSTETQFRFQFANRDDPARELLLTVMAFDVPTAQRN